MDIVKSNGLVVGATLIGALGCYYLSQRRDSKKPKRSKQGSKCNVMFYDADSARCLGNPDHKILDCLSEQCPIKHLRKLKAVLNTATSSVDVCLYNLTHPELERTLINLISKGVKLRCVVGKRSDDEREFVTKLRANGAFMQVKDNKPPPGLNYPISDLLMHHKFVIIDNRILITGSMNWTSQSIHGHWDHMLVFTDKFLINQFVDEFETLFTQTEANERCSLEKPSANHPFQACFFKKKGSLCRNDANRRKRCEKEDCVFPLYKAVLFKLLATSTIDICAQQLTLEDLSHQIVCGHENGVKVRVICDKTMARGTGSQVPVFIDAGISVRMQQEEGVLHHKFIIVDGKTLISGSLNWTMQSFFGNYENILFVTETNVVSIFQSQFEKMYDAFTPVTKELLKLAPA